MPLLVLDGIKDIRGETPLEIANQLLVGVVIISIA
jgi:hypothetical protein